MKSALRSASCLQALSLTGLAVGAVAISAPAAAQDLTAGVIVADEYDAEIVRPAPSHPLAVARRKVEIERLARTALRRQLVVLDPHCSTWGQGLG